MYLLILHLPKLELRCKLQEIEIAPYDRAFTKCVCKFATALCSEFDRSILISRECHLTGI